MDPLSFLLAVGLLIVGLGVGMGIGVGIGRSWRPTFWAAERAELLADGSSQLARLVDPLSDTLGKVESQLVDSERRGAASHAAVLREMELVRASSDQLRDSSGALLTALRKPQARGQWGEMQLRRVVELAGMVERCDFDVQCSARTAAGVVRPDMVVRLAGARSIVVDAKVPLSAFLEAAELPDGPARVDRLAAHARQLRTHVDGLAAKDYWAAFSGTPEFVVLFVPGDSFLSAALESDPALLDHAFRQRVHILTPTTLISALRTIAVEWQHDVLTDSAREVVDAGRELHKRLATYARHVDRLGRALGGAVDHYNASLGSLERNVVSQSRRLAQLHVSEPSIECPQPIDEPLRRLSSPALLTEPEDHQVIALRPSIPGGDADAAPG